MGGGNWDKTTKYYKYGIKVNNKEVWKRIPTPVFWPEEFHGLQFLGLQRVGHNGATFTSLPF